MINPKNMKLFAVGDSNWDLYQDASGYLFAVAKPGSGSANACFGWPEHLNKLEKAGINHGYKII